MPKDGPFYFFLNAFFHALHLLIVAFIALGWVLPQTRIAHIAFILLTLGSWLILGRALGKQRGYCPVTEWHWVVKERWGEGRPRGPYIHFLAEKLSGKALDQAEVGRVVLWLTLASAAMSFGLSLLG